MEFCQKSKKSNQGIPYFRVKINSYTVFGSQKTFTRLFPF